MTEKQKAMFVLYGIRLKEGLTKGMASELIDQAKQLGVIPTEESQEKANKLFRTIERQEAKEKFKSLGKEIQDGIKTIQSRKTKLDELEDLKERFEAIFSDLDDMIQTRIDEIEEEEFEKANEDDEY